YTPATGIWQTVWIEPVPEIHAQTITITHDVDLRRAFVRVAMAKTPATKVKATATLKADGKVVGTSSREVDRTKEGFKISEEDKKVIDRVFNFVFEFQAGQMKTWSPEDPFLYDLAITISDGKTEDAITSYLAMRKISLGLDDGILRIKLNYKPHFQ